MSGSSEKAYGARELSDWLRLSAIDIRLHLTESVVSMVRAGRDLADVRASIEHGVWTAWVVREFAFSVRTAERLVAVARMFRRLGIEDGERVNADLTALYLMASPSVDDEVRMEALDYAVGRRLTRTVVEGMARSAADRAMAADIAESIESDVVRGLLDSYGMTADLVGPLAVLEREDPELFGEIAATGHLETSTGDQIPLADATIRDLRKAIGRQRVERAKTSPWARRVVLLVLPDERPLSLNRFFGRAHWVTRKAWTDEVKTKVVVELNRLLGPEPEAFDEPVAITVRAWFANRPLDASNIAVKPYEDGLVGRILVDDSPKWVVSMTTESRVDRDRPRVEIEVRGAN